MARTPILLDSNSYFRLARSVHPLLDHQFGEEHYRLYVIQDLEAEFNKSPRLRRKFHWINEREYAANRERPLPLSRPQRKEVAQAYDFIYNHARTEGIGVSPVDVRALATAYALQVPVVTDDQAMLSLAADFGIQTMNTLGLVCLMLDAGRIDMERVRQIAAYWQYEKDTPAGFREDYRRLFGEPVPSSQ